MDLNIFRCFQLPLKYKNQPVNSAKESSGVLIRTALSLHTNLGRIHVLTVLSLPTHEHALPPHSFLSRA